MMNNRTLEFIYQDDGQIEGIAFAASESRKGVRSEGYRDSGIPDLMIDLHPITQKPYCFMSINFHKSYPSVIWGLRLLMNDELFDLPQAGLHNVSLAEAFSWAYTHFVLKETSLRSARTNGRQTSFAHQVLEHALVGV
jgi:hypothetical protein